VIVGLWAKFYGWLVAAGAVLLTIGGAVFYGWRKGRTGVQAKVAEAQAQQQVNTATAIVKRNEVRTDVDAQVAKLPASPVGQVTVPAPLPVPGSAADQLQQQWSRD
jgi:hypothetical protein